MGATDDADGVERVARDDEEIVRRVRSGNVDAFALLVSRYQRQIIALGHRFFRRREDVEDFAQEVFLQAFRKLDTFRGTGRFYSWLVRIGYNRGYRETRSAPRFDLLPCDTAVDAAPGPDEALERAQAQRAVADAIARLPARYADCVALYYFFDLSYQEVSTVTGFTLNTVRSHIRRGKRLLAVQLSAEHTGGSPPDSDPRDAGGRA